MELTLAPFLDASILLAAFLIKAGFFHATLRLIGRGLTHLKLPRSLLAATLVATISLYALPQLIKVLPAPMLRTVWILTVTGVTLCLCAIPLTRFICDVHWYQAVVSALVLVAASMLLDHYVPKIAAAVLPPGSSFAQYRSEADKAIAAVGALATNAPDRNAAGVVAKGLDALATLTTQSEQEAIKGDVIRGLEMFAERKKLMSEMTEAERAEYRREMSAFLTEMNMPSNRYSLARAWNFSSNDVASLAAALAEARQIQAQAAPERPVRSIAESITVLTTNLTSLKLTEADTERIRKTLELFAANDVEQAFAAVAADMKTSGGKSPVSAALLTAMAQWNATAALPAGTASTTNTAEVAIAKSSPDTPAAAGEPQVTEEGFVPIWKEVFVSNALPFGILKLPATLTNSNCWIRAARNLQVKGYACRGTNGIALLTDGSLLEVGDAWKGLCEGDVYTFVVEAIADKKLTLAIAPAVRAPQSDAGEGSIDIIRQ